MQYEEHVVIVGGGFGGLYAAKKLGNKPLKVTLIDKRNFHLFQPLLYQVATGGLSPGEIASPLRAILNKFKNIHVLNAEVVDIDTDGKEVLLRDGAVHYDSLIVATGASHHYFGNDDWAELAQGLKTVEDAIEIRRRILFAFEAAERETDPSRRNAWMTFVIIGAGPTGVELAGTLGELARGTLKKDFKNINPADAKILLLEGVNRVLPTFPSDLSAKAESALKKLGVQVRTKTLVTDIKDSLVTITSDDQQEQIRASTILWAAGVKASFIGTILSKRAGVELDSSGKVKVEPDLTVKGHPNIFVVGDLAAVTDKYGNPLPGMAPVAMQEGKYAANTILGRIKGEQSPPFHYVNKGSLAVIGRHAGVADFGSLRFGGFFAWLLWLFVHIMYLVEFDNKILVLFQWAWNYFTRNRGARLITGKTPFPILESKQEEKRLGVAERK